MNVWDKFILGIMQVVTFTSRENRQLSCLFYPGVVSHFWRRIFLINDSRIGLYVGQEGRSAIASAETYFFLLIILNGDCEQKGM